MKSIAILAAVLLLSACAGAPTAPAVVKEAVYQPCDVPTPPRPVFPADSLTGDEDLFTLGKTLWADRLARQAYEVEVRTALEGCTKKAGD